MSMMWRFHAMLRNFFPQFDNAMKGIKKQSKERKTQWKQWLGSILQARRSGTLTTKTAHNRITSNRFITQKPKMKPIAVTIEENMRGVCASAEKKETSDVEGKKHVQFCLWNECCCLPKSYSTYAMEFISRYWHRRNIFKIYMILVLLWRIILEISFSNVRHFKPLARVIQIAFCFFFI